MQKKNLIMIAVAILFTAGLVLYMQQPRMTFTDDEIHLSLYQEVDVYEYIEKTSHMNINEIEVEHDIDNKKLGSYLVLYKYQKKTFKLMVYIDDTSPPQFEIRNSKLLLNKTLDPTSLVYNIVDDSETHVYFKEDYLFNETKTYKVVVVVEDAYGNTTEKNSYVLVEEKDEEAPSLTGLDPITILAGDEIDLKKGVVALDDHDPNPKLSIDDSNLNITKEGEYEVMYTAEDESGNKTAAIRYVEVLSQYANRVSVKDGVKTCYLTFDDGPSAITPEVLDILDKYNIKATFFVTGTQDKYYDWIGEAYKRGHVIGLHTFSHDYEAIYSSLRSYVADLNKIKELVYQQTGEYTKVMRFPGGSSNLVSKKYNDGIMSRLSKKVIDLGYQYYDWTCINGDGENIKTVSGLVNKAVEEVQLAQKNGQEDIMFLMHDSASCANTVKALPTILDYLLDQGYVFDVISDYSPTFHHSIQN